MFLVSLAPLLVIKMHLQSKAMVTKSVLNISRSSFIQFVGVFEQVLMKISQWGNQLLFHSLPANDSEGSITKDRFVLITYLLIHLDNLFVSSGSNTQEMCLWL